MVSHSSLEGTSLIKGTISIGLRKYFIKGGYLGLIMAEIEINHVKLRSFETKKKNYGCFSNLVGEGGEG